MIIQRTWRGSVGRERANVERRVLDRAEVAYPALPRDVLVRFFCFGYGVPKIAPKAPYPNILQQNRNATLSPTCKHVWMMVKYMS